MLKFNVTNHGEPIESMSIRNAYLIGSDNNAMRGEIVFDDGTITATKREQGSAAMALQMPVGECGELTIQTCLLPDREEPYLLSLELVRHRLMLLFSKLEEWGLFDLSSDHVVSQKAESAKANFVEALCLARNDEAKADELAREALVEAVDATEELAITHAESLLHRRRHHHTLPRQAIGSGVPLAATQERVKAALAGNFDFVQLPTPWREIAPHEGDYRWDQLDHWIDWAVRQKMPTCAGPVISFDPSVLPDWLYIWEHDYETMRDMLYEHIERVVGRYKEKVAVWNVVSGLHVNNHFALNFDQLIELTRMSVMAVRKVAPSSRVMVELREPFGEYYGRNHRAIPPQMYADLLIQGAIPFDVFGVKLLMGQATSGQYTRDLMQVSAILDQFAGLGKPVRLTIGAPSETVTEIMIASPDPNQPVDANCGFWRKPWSQTTQSRWMETVMHVGLSKPFIESVAWHELIDHPDAELPLGGMITEDLEPKAAMKRLSVLHRRMRGETQVDPPSPRPE